MTVFRMFAFNRSVAIFFRVFQHITINGTGNCHFRREFSFSTNPTAPPINFDDFYVLFMGLTVLNACVKMDCSFPPSKNPFAEATKDYFYINFIIFWEFYDTFYEDRKPSYIIHIQNKHPLAIDFRQMMKILKSPSVMLQKRPWKAVFQDQ